MVRHEIVPKSVSFDLKLYLEVLRRMKLHGVANFSAVINRYVRLGMNKELEMESQTMEIVRTEVNDRAKELADEIYQKQRERDIDRFKTEIKKAEVVKDVITPKSKKKTSVS